MITWETITVGAFQDIQCILNDSTLDEMERTERIVCSAYGMTVAEFDNLNLPQLKTHKSEVFHLLNQKIPKRKPVRSFKIKGKKYRIEYNPARIRAQQFKEFSYAQDDMIRNLHKIVASFVVPVKFGFRKKDMGFEQLSELLKEAPFIHIYNVANFFTNLFAASIETLRPTLMSEMEKAGLAKGAAETLISLSKQTIDRSIFSTESH